MQDTRSPLLTTEKAGEYLDTPTSSLEKWRRLNMGPRFVRLDSKRVRYRQSDLDAWLDTRICSRASELRNVAA